MTERELFQKGLKGAMDFLGLYFFHTTDLHTGRTMMCLGKRGTDAHLPLYFVEFPAGRMS